MVYILAMINLQNNIYLFGFFVGFGFYFSATRTRIAHKVTRFQELICSIAKNNIAHVIAVITIVTINQYWHWVSSKQ